MFRTKERDEWLEFSKPIYALKVALYTRAAAAAVTTMESLKGRRVGVVRKSIQETFVRKNHPEVIPVLFNNSDEVIRATANSDVEAFFAAPVRMSLRLGAMGLADVLRPTGEVLYSGEFRAGVRKGDAELAGLIDEGLSKITPEELVEIEARWVPDPAYRYFESGDATQDLSAAERAWLAEHPVIRMTPDPAFPPLEFLDDAGQFRSFGADVTRLIEERLGIKFKIVWVKDWAEATRRSKSRENDVWSIVARTPEREKYMLFTDSFVESPLVIVVSKQNEKTLKPEDLKDMTVTYVTDYASGDWMTRYYPGYDYLPAPDTQTGLKMVSFGIADAMVVNVALASYYIETKGITNLRVAGETGHVLRWGFASRSDWPVLHDILKKGLAKITSEEFQAISRKWIFLKAAPWTLTRQHVIIGLTVLGVLILIGVLTWNRALQRRITLRTQELQDQLSERKRAEEARTRAEARLKDAIENVSEGFSIYDADDRLMLCNSKYMEIYGYSDEDVKPGINVSKLIDLDIARGIVSANDEGAKTARRRAKNLGESLETFDLALTDGRWIQIRDGRTSDGGTVSIHADITDRKRAEEDMAEKEAQLRAVLDNMPGGIRFVDRDKNYVFFNSQYSELYDFPDDLLQVGDSNRVEDLYQAKRGDYGPGDPDALTDEWLGKLPVNEEPQSWDSKTPQGKTLHVNTAPTPSGGVINIVTDITERKRAEELQRIILETIPLPMSVVRKSDGIFLYCNEPHAALVGDRAEDIVGTHAVDVYWDPGDRDRFLELFIKHGRVDDFEVERKDADGNPYWALVSSRPITFQGEESILSAQTVITERKQAEEELRDQHRFIELLHSISEASNEAATINDAFKACLDEICAKTGWPVGHVYVHNPEQEVPLESSKVWHLDKPRKFAAFRKITEVTGFRSGEGLPGRVLKSYMAAWIKDVTEDDNFPRAKQAKNIGVRAGLAFPIMLGNQVLAVFEFFSEQAEDPDQRTLDMLANVGRQLGGVIARKRAEEELAEKEAQLRIVLDNMPDGIRCFDKDFRFLFFNSRYSELWDLPEGLLKIGDFVGVEDTYLAERGDYGDGDIDELVNEVIYGRPFETEPQHFERMTINGRILDCRSRPTELGVLSIHTDITERKQAEARLAEKEALTRHIMEASPVGVNISTKEGLNLYANERALEIEGITR